MAFEESEKSEKKISNITADITIAVVVLLIAIGFLGIYIREVIDWYQRLLEWFYSKDWQGINFWLAIIFSLINAGLLGLIIFVLMRYSKLPELTAKIEKLKEEAPTPPKEEVSQQWEHIRGLANSSNPSDWNMAILRADALFDDMLQHLGYAGLTLADRLKIVDPTKLSSLDNVWSAHRLRNMIAHDPLEQHTRETIIHSLRSYEQALRDLGMFVEKP